MVRQLNNYSDQRNMYTKYGFLLFFEETGQNEIIA